jgi:deoxyribonuclease IV
MLYGLHVSAAGGLENAPLAAGELGLTTFQFFTWPPQGSFVRAITDEAVGKFRTACEAGGFERYYVHAPFILNLASAEKRIRDNSVAILKTELERASALGAYAVMFHPGSASGVGDEEGVRLAIEGLRAILKGYRGTARLLVEISAGAGMVIGDTFEEVGRLLAGAAHDDLGVCFDTAHAFASGYDLRTPETVAAVMKQFDKYVGFDRMPITHLNDSKVPFGAHKDRHEHLGDGEIGIDGIRALLAHKQFGKLDMVMETEDDGWTGDLAAIRKIIKEVA